MARPTQYTEQEIRIIGVISNKGKVHRTEVVLIEGYISNVVTKQYV